ncbi:50S ribosomal protein L24 [Candidatus Ichthyocystis hellenicum]|uniref:50S ribosomal protein L24 n=1 Tax=Candidatus Ichthyocystis hellenicum TaxID=1561003 RepID=UPI000ADCBECF|nr:50S ribosomal protein L24 [Candidatus Ichthyocystis hellenicum]
MRKIIKGDTVVVISGSAKGRKGEVLAVLDGKKVLVRGVNVCKKHVKPNPAKNEVGGIVSKEMPIDISNVALFCERDGRGYSVGFVFSEGKKKRVFKIAGERLPV